MFKSTKSAVKFFFILISVFTLCSCDELAHYQPKKNVSLQTQSNQYAPELTVKPLLRGVYSDMNLSLDALDNPEKADFLRDVLEGLVVYDQHGQIIPAVAESWQTQDNKLWQFKLRQSAKWSNGESVTATDFVQSWRALALSNSPLKQYLQFMNLAYAQDVLAGKVAVEKLGVHALDDGTLQLQLDKPTPYLLEMLAHVALLPKKLGQDHSFLMNGAYRVLGQQGPFITLEKNPNYWNFPKVHFEQVVYQKLQPDQPVTGMDWVAMPAGSTQGNQQFPQLCTYFYEFNFKDPYLKQSAVRTALVSMISVQNIVQNEKLSMLPSNSFLPRNMWLEDNSEWQANVVEQLLQQAGISENQPLTLTITYDNSGFHPNIAQRIARAWAQSDLIRVISDPVTWAQLQEKRQKGHFQVIRSGWCADYNEPSAFLLSLHSAHPDNKMGFKNAEMDALLEKSLKAETVAERAKLYDQIQRVVKTERIFLPIFQYTQHAFVASSVAGFETDNPTGVVYSKDLYRKTNSN